MAKHKSIDKRYKKLAKPLKAKFNQLIHSKIKEKDNVTESDQIR